MNKYFIEGLNAVAREIHDRAVLLGWYEDDKVRPFDGQLMNVVAEVAEAQEEWRNGRAFNETYWKMGPFTPADGPMPTLKFENGKSWVRDYEMESEHAQRGRYDQIWRELTPEMLRNMPNMIGRLKPEGIPSEMADIIIRVLDMCSGLGIDIAAAIADKMAYNEHRPYRHGGKRS